MIIYLHTFDTAENAITVKAVEVTEKNKTYEAVKRLSLYPSTDRVKKTEIGVFHSRYQLYMLALKPSVEDFKNQLKLFFESKRDYSTDMAVLAQNIINGLGVCTVQETGLTI